MAGDERRIAGGAAARDPDDCPGLGADDDPEPAHRVPAVLADAVAEPRPGADGIGPDAVSGGGSGLGNTGDCGARVLCPGRYADSQRAGQRAGAVLAAGLLVFRAVVRAPG